MKPTFLIIGVMKSATTSALAYLHQHKDIYVNWGEVHFFDKDENYRRGIPWYESNFRGCNDQIGEKTPMYIFSKKAVRRIAKNYPHMKLIIFLRDPIKRAFSHYLHIIKMKKILDTQYSKERMTFLDRIKRDLKKENFEVPQTILQKGFYIDQVEYLLTKFPKKNIKIVIAERYNKDPLKYNNEIFKFLGLKKLKSIVEKKHNRSWYSRDLSKYEIDFLKKIYQPYNERLFKFLGYRIEEWI